MNFKSLAMIAATGLVFAACSNEDSVPVGEQSYYGDTYAKIEINLPTTNSTRASLGEYENGLEKEYNIENGYLILFAGATEPDAECVAVGTLSVGNDAVQDEKSTISNKRAATVKFTDFNLAEAKDAGNIYGLLILNNNQIVLPSNGMKFSAWNTTTPIDASLLNVDGPTFTMTSAPNVAQTPTEYLQKIDASKFQNSLDDLSKVDAQKFYVQRVVAKIRMTRSNDQDGKFVVEGTENEEGTNQDYVTINDWTVDMTNQKSYPVQDVMFPSTSTVPGHFSAVVESGFSRAFWGTDPSYNKDNDVVRDHFWVASPSDLTHHFKATPENEADNYAYCLENTMNYDKMMQGQTTRVIIKGTYVKGEGAAKSFFKYGETIYDIDYINSKLSSPIDNLAFADSEEGGYTNIAALFPGKASVIADALKIDEDATVSYYKNGECYYVVLIRHFDNEEAGLGDKQITHVSDYTEAHLGRYGVVRNNIYNVNISGVTKMGYPQIPDPTDPNDPDTPPTEPNDSQELYLKCEINVLAWANRKQDEKL
ncbi:MAG: Mfa1 fimbrilin C-terminal domain-containing protein [Muribaculaceae bacterium]|nr:Mfa1 fimbrilin C-terminal domain-containing protein [Muribaculaceae bacterium]